MEGIHSVPLDMSTISNVLPVRRDCPNLLSRQTLGILCTKEKHQGRRDDYERPVSWLWTQRCKWRVLNDLLTSPRPVPVCVRVSIVWKRTVSDRKWKYIWTTTFTTSWWREDTSWSGPRFKTELTKDQHTRVRQINWRDLEFNSRDKHSTPIILI